MLTTLWPPRNTVNERNLVQLARNFVQEDKLKYESNYFELLDLCLKDGGLHDSALKDELFWHAWHGDDIEKVIELYPDYGALLNLLRSEKVSAAKLFAFLDDDQNYNCFFLPKNSKQFKWRLMNEILSEYPSEEDRHLLNTLAYQSMEETKDFRMMFAMCYPLWSPHAAVPDSLKYALTHSKTLTPQNILSTIGSLKINDVVRRNAFASALLETAIVGHSGQHVLGQVIENQEIDCATCFTPINAGENFFKMSQECQATLCLDCAPNSLQNLVDDNQCQWACGCTVHSETAMVMESPKNTISSIRKATVDQYFENLPNWSSCEVEACIGGHYDSKTPSILERISKTIKPMLYDAPESPQNADTCGVFQHSCRVKRLLSDDQLIARTLCG